VLRGLAGERLLLLASFSAGEQRVPAAIVAQHGLVLDPAEAAAPDGRPLRVEGDALVLAPYQFLWIAG